MKPLIVANWKMNPQSLAEARKLFNSVKKGIKNIKNVEVVTCPPFIYLFSLIGKPSRQAMKLGAQDVFWGKKGAFTGEVSPLMLKDLGCQYVIIGHSERRKYFGETDEMINKKIRAALDVGLKPILCIENILQLRKDLKGIENCKLKIENLIVAYEPVFAIGTGKPCSIGQARRMRNNIKYPTVLYGGSVNSENAADYINKAGFEGLLVGGASLWAKEFIKIVKSARG